MKRKNNEEAMKRKTDDEGIVACLSHEFRDQPNIKRRKLEEPSTDLDLLRFHRTHYLLCNEKLILVLDLDQTLIDARDVGNLTSEEEYLLDPTNLAISQVKADLFMFAPQMLIKLRPFVRMFLKAANHMFEMYIYTKASRLHALRIARLLDPHGNYFVSRIISKDDRPGCDKKSLYEVLGHENVILILDDNSKVWPNHQDNLITIQKYQYFASKFLRRHDDTYKSLAEKKIDESESDGVLKRILEVLQNIHRLFFHPEIGVEVAYRDVRLILKLIRQKVLAGCALYFGEVMNLGPPEESHIWGMAEELGAMCCVELGPAVTHVVTVDLETEEARWAEQTEKFLVHPTWLQAAYFTFQRNPEDNFPIEKF
jgi:RNA polymerase II C-terminal domain phosphatase-like 3/4